MRGEKGTGWSTHFLKTPHALRMANRKNLYSQVTLQELNFILGKGRLRAQELRITEYGGQGRKAR